MTIGRAMFDAKVLPEPSLQAVSTIFASVLTTVMIG